MDRLTVELSSDMTRQLICDDLQSDLEVIMRELNTMDLRKATAEEICERIDSVYRTELSGQLPDSGTIGEIIVQAVQDHIGSKEYKEGDMRVFADL